MNDGSLNISSFIVKRQDKSVNLNVLEHDQDVLIKLVVACYINPTRSFKIKLGKKINIPEFLNQKDITSGLEFVEVDGLNITYESSMTIDEPDSLLKTLVRKVKNLLVVMINDYNIKLINKYEEEIDKSKTLIYKATIGALSFHEKSNLKPLELHYIALISMNLEEIVDHLRFVDKNEKDFLNNVLGITNKIKLILENLNEFDYKQVLELTKDILRLDNITIKDVRTYDKKRVKEHLVNLSEVLLDWSVTKELEKT
ncbi:hypothetical protein CMO89_00765 [Candidatus Woesearchaeota archaeon]|nr:hypothetical protein [Candidatus Woesearchaeota archaeon]